MSLNEIASNKMFGGWHKRFSHFSKINNCTMTFAIYLPPQIEAGEKLPVLYWLSGLTCSDENFMQKAAAQRIAAELGLVIVAADTSPRGDDVPDDADAAYDFGLGAGFYLNASEAPWQKNYQMQDYIVEELPALIEANFPVSNKRSIAGHSMGGHGALTLGLKYASHYQSISAFSPICNPATVPWGEKAFSLYLGDNKETWLAHDSCHLIKNSDKNCQLPILIDQGEDDAFLTEQLCPERLQKAAAEADYPIQLRMQAGYDHSYFFIASFIEEHLRFHAGFLKA
ncbi:MAG: S-formylglutathione hydrolase [Pseudomonadales bacterium]|nr:S-formylglutathione hydrolase [Pseudomonadales bacterium]